MSVNVVLVCHASTPATRAGAFPLDEPLDKQGAQRAAALKGQLPRAVRTCTSPSLAARQTAMALGLDATVELALRDCDFGRWAGRGLDDVSAQEPQALAAWLADPASAPHGGEGGLQLLDRAGTWLEECSRQPGRMVAVTHAVVIRAAIIHAIGATPRTFAHLDVAPLSFTLLSCQAGHWRLRSTGARL